jgi:hypothetical protein
MIMSEFALVRANSTFQRIAIVPVNVRIAGGSFGIGEPMFYGSGYFERVVRGFE